MDGVGVGGQEGRGSSTNTLKVSPTPPEQHAELEKGRIKINYDNANKEIGKKTKKKNSVASSFPIPIT